MARATDDVFDVAVEHLDREYRRLEHLAASTTSLGFDRDGFAATSRALSYVVMAGVLERMMRELLAALASDVLALGVERKKLPPSLIAVIDTAIFRQCGSNSVAALIARSNVVQLVGAHENDSRIVEDFSDVFSLADGKTIGEQHFEALWMLLGFSGDWRNSANDSLVVREIHDKRNDVAHWSEDPVNIGRTKTASDLKGMIKRLIDLVQHLQLHVSYWLDDRQASPPAA